MKNLFSHNYFLGYVNEVTPHNDIVQETQKEIEKLKDDLTIDKSAD